MTSNFPCRYRKHTRVKMDASTVAPIIISVISVFILRFTIKLANKFWFRPKKVEKRLREIGFKGNPYRFFFGDTIEMERMRIQATSRPMELFSNDIAWRVLPYHHYSANKHGMKIYALTHAISFLYYYMALCGYVCWGAQHLSSSKRGGYYFIKSIVALSLTSSCF